MTTDVTANERLLLCDAQTSGGLLAAVPESEGWADYERIDEIGQSGKSHWPSERGRSGKNRGHSVEGWIVTGCAAGRDCRKSRTARRREPILPIFSCCCH